MEYEFRSLRESELPAWFDHVSLVFTGIGRAYFMQHWFADPWRDLEGILVATHRGRIVSTVRVFDRRIHVGGAVLAMGGIGEVSTHPDFRRQGLSGRLLQDAIALMRRRRVAVSVLFTGRYGHYGRYGWERVPVPLLRLTGLPASLVPPTGSTATPTVHKVDWGQDLEGVMALYDAEAAALAGPIVRSAPYWWNWLRPSTDHLLVGKRSGTPVAYLVAGVRDGTLRVQEYAARPGDETALLSLLDEARRQPQPSGHGPLPVVVPGAMDTRLGGGLSRAAAGVESQRREPMYSVIDATALAQAMTPVWHERLQRAGWQGRLRLDTGMGAFVLNASAGTLTVVDDAPLAKWDHEVRLPHAAFLHALLGQPQPDEPSDAADDRVVQALFPPLDHVFWGSDSF
jgi:predicted N-acetyltransferase YhbS